MRWVSTITPPDGIRTSFAFPSLPKWISYNGVNYFPGTGYTVVVSGGHYNITLLDIDGNVIIPDVGDEIKEETL